jgi:hypothetical protein
MICHLHHKNYNDNAIVCGGTQLSALQAESGEVPVLDNVIPVDCFPWLSVWEFKRDMVYMNVLIRQNARGLCI